MVRTDDPARRSPNGDSTEPVPTVRLDAVTGAPDVGHHDPTEDYHEASRLYRGIVDPLVVGGARLEHSVELRASAARSSKRHRHLPSVELPRPDLCDVSLGDALALRRSTAPSDRRALSLVDIGTLLGAAYGVNGVKHDGRQTVRTAPSGGGLYPLELYLVARRVRGLGAALYHYDPFRHALELVRRQDCNDELGRTTPYRELVDRSGAVVAITAMFWRSRFKYGQRAYRLTLLEAGHVAQNLLLAVAARGLAATPLAGFYDRSMDALLGADGIHEASLYVVPIGTGVA